MKNANRTLEESSSVDIPGGTKGADTPIVTRPFASRNRRRDLVATKPPKSEEHFKATLEDKLSILRGDLSCSIPEIGLDSFLDFLLPPIWDQIDIDGIISLLRSGGLVTTDGKWKAFENAPSRSSESEEVTFAPLAEISKNVVDFASAQTGLEPNFALSLPRHAQPKPQGARKSCPDGYVILHEADERARRATNNARWTRWWYDIALTTEFKKKGGRKDQNENVSKLMFNIQQTMTLDPCRRFTFGITIENTKMRLWFCSRATPIVSEAFDFTTAIKPLTHVFLSLMFASKEELGWDPTIRPFIKDNGQRAYRIDVRDEIYETEQLLSDYSADALVSQAARVWKVRHVASGERYVLKDVWLDDDRDVEHNIHEAILRDIEDKYGVNARRDAAPHLLTPIAHCFVRVNGVDDHTTDIIMRGFSPSMKHRLKVRVKKAKSYTDLGGSSDADLQSIWRELKAPFPRCLHRRKVHRRKHYRIIFREVAQVLYKVRKLSDVFTVLIDGAKVLKWIHGCGWVHRDISPGNLYLYEGRGLVGDLEYAKQRSLDAVDERRIGTPDFMAAEAVARHFKHLREDEDIEVARRILSQSEGERRKNLDNFGKRNDVPTFFHNDLHDLESLWWVAIWELFFNRKCSEVICEGERSEEQVRMRLIAADTLFHVPGATGERSLFFRRKSVYDEKTEWVPDQLLDIQEILDDARVVLLQKYIDFEAEFPAIRMDVFEGTYEILLMQFEACRDSAYDQEAVALPTVGQALTTDGGIYRRPGDASIPSLDHDSGGHTSSSSLSEVDSGGQDSALSITSAVKVTNQVSGKGRSALDDFLIPMPSLCIPRSSHELEELVFPPTSSTSTLPMNTSDDTTRTTTPPNKSRPISQNAFTPVSHHSTQDLGYLTGVTDLMRDAVRKDVDYIAIESRRTSSTRPDAHFICEEIEATLKEKEKETNATLPLGNTDTRLWFCSRSILIVSEAFDFRTNVHLVTRVFLSFAFASEEELGWDPTICPIQNDDGERAYIITVDNETYETVKVIADHGADSLISRGVRLWLVKNTRTGEPCILKDIWIEHDRQSERLIHATMLQDIEDEYGVEIRKEAELHLLTPVQDWIVRVDGIEDHTTNMMLRGYEPPFQTVFHLKIEATKSDNLKKSVQPPAPSDPVLEATRLKKWSVSALLDARRKKLHHRKHYRVVFKEIGECIHTLTGLANVFVVLRDSARVLEWIHGAQWVHRDISVGNLYFYDGRGVIGDFEYAKKRDSNVSHEVRSCSIDFVSSEVIKHAFQYLPSDTTWRPRSKMKSKKPENANIVQFFHNDLHDLESLWWIAIWELLFHRSNVDEELDEESAALQDSEREKAIYGRQAYGDAIGWINDTFYELVGILNQFRVLLTTRYRDFEASFPCVDWGRLQGIHKEIQQIFEQCRGYAFDIKIELLPYKLTDLWNLTSPSNDEDDADNQSEEEHEASQNEEKTAEDLLHELNLNEDGESDGDDEDEDNCPPFLVHMVKYKVK
ncbi:hypothetical protein A7U60_g2142 [Sanghuangporus baumii]|uniref:Fungal-type protein kinase domain-containing protein n=1 Tax=Sanghuangporus baumii TaxID=108892 RepID=A0A9Q5I2T2_SANBA|nr:hypothetical protein A7U60_g2142 [Sanghuangporus baumii]